MVPVAALRRHSLPANLQTRDLLRCALLAEIEERPHWEPQALGHLLNGLE